MSFNMDFWFQLTIILVMQITQFQLSRGVYGGCQEAVYNVEVVTSCPKSKEEWGIAASKKHCSKIAAVAKEKNCTIDEIQPKYHCVINALRTKLLEVCADEKRISGHCAEFNEVGRVIQIHNTAPCEKVFPNCDGSYSSVDAYKYQGCYKLVNQTKVTTDFDIDYPTSGYGRINIIIATVIAALLCGLAVAIALCLKRRGERGIQKQESDMEEQKTLMGNALENKTDKECTERANAKMALKKIMLDHNEDTKTPTVPDDIKKCLSGRSDVVGYTMMRNSSLEVRIEKETDAKELEKDLMNIYSKFFKRCTCPDATSLNDVRKYKTSSNKFINHNQTAQREDEFVSSKRDLPVLESPKTREIIYQRGEKSVTLCFSDTDEGIEIKLRF